MTYNNRVITSLVGLRGEVQLINRLRNAGCRVAYNELRDRHEAVDFEVRESPEGALEQCVEVQRTMRIYSIRKLEDFVRSRKKDCTVKSIYLAVSESGDGRHESELLLSTIRIFRHLKLRANRVICLTIAPGHPIIVFADERLEELRQRFREAPVSEGKVLARTPNGFAILTDRKRKVSCHFQEFADDYVLDRWFADRQNKELIGLRVRFHEFTDSNWVMALTQADCVRERPVEARFNPLLDPDSLKKLLSRPA